jgi:hypothetical protein
MNAPRLERCRAARGVLLGLDHRHVTTVSIVVAGDIPQVVMFSGEPFLLKAGSGAELVYVQTRPYRADRSVTIEAAR